MTLTALQQVQKKIEILKAEEAKLLAAEVKGVIARINEAILTYGIAPGDLSFSSTTPTTKSPKSVAKVVPEARTAPTKSPPVKKPASAAKTESVARRTSYADGKGNKWSGMGPMPQWLKAALKDGKSLASLVAPDRVAAPTNVPPMDTPATPTEPADEPKPKVKSKIKALYRDSATGSSWTGRGSQPIWLRTAIAGGRTLEDFATVAGRKHAALKSKAAAKSATSAKPKRVRTASPKIDNDATNATNVSASAN